MVEAQQESWPARAPRTLLWKLEADGLGRLHQSLEDCRISIGGAGCFQGCSGIAVLRF